MNKYRLVALNKTLEHEGGWSDHPRDPGGATMLGITRDTYEKYLGHSVTKEALKNIPELHLQDIYKTKYWDVVHGDDLPVGIDICVFDFAVNSGPSRAIRMLQSFVGATIDGAMGPLTIAATVRWVQENGSEECIIKYQNHRQHFLESLATFDTFGKGWTRRVKDIRDCACSVVHYERNKDAETNE